MGNPPVLRKICRWCEVKGVLTVIQEGEEPTSHGICPACAETFRDQIEKLRVPRSAAAPSVHESEGKDPHGGARGDQGGQG